MIQRGLRRGASALVVSSALLFAAACSGDSGKPTLGTSPTPSRQSSSAPATARPGDWTFFVYMDADNNLEPSALDDLREMTQARGTQFIVLVDRSAGYVTGDAVGLGDFTDARLVRIVDGRVQQLQDVGELDMGSPATLTTFLSTSLKQYKRSHNALVVWDHGGGWNGAAWDDESSGNHLDMLDLPMGIQGGLVSAGLPKLDMIGFDACLMADFDIAGQLAGKADYLLASEEVEPGQGWDWSAVSASRPMTTVDLAREIAHGFTSAAQGAGILDTTLSLVDLAKLGPVKQALQQLDSAVTGSAVRQVVGRIAAARAASVSFGRDPDPKFDAYQVDLGSLADGLQAVPQVGSAAAALKQAVAGAVVSVSNGPIADSAAGLALYFPPSTDYRDRNYRGASAPLIDAFYAAAKSVPDNQIPMYTDTDRFLERNQVREDANGVHLSATVTPGTGGNVTMARIFWGHVDMKDTSNVVYYGRRNAVVAGDTISGDYDWKFLTVSDGRTRTLAFSDLQVDRSGTPKQIAIPLRYLRGTQTAWGRLVLSLVDGKIGAETFYVRSGPGIAAIEPQPGDRFIPLLRKHRFAETHTVRWIPATNTPLVASKGGLSYTYQKAPSAQPIMLGLSCENLRGFWDFVYYGTASP